jgi:hypothetical protein
VVDRVLEQVCEQLLQAARVCLDQVVGRQFEVRVGGVDVRPHVLGGGRDVRRLCRLDGRALLREGQQVVDEVGHPLVGVVYLPYLGRFLLELLGEQREVDLGDVERVPEVV